MCFSFSFSHLQYTLYSMICCRILPFGAVHAVATLEEVATEGRQILPGPAIMFGGSGFLRLGMEASLAHGIHYAVWHQDWSNSNHDDFIVTILKMLRWQLMYQRNQPRRPFSGRNFYALLVMGFLHVALHGLPYDKNCSLTQLLQVPDRQRQAGDKAATFAQELLDGLSSSNVGDFNAFRAEYLGMFAEEVNHKMLIDVQQHTA